jgi:DNA-binding GntR family transcriptional regulator
MAQAVHQGDVAVAQSLVTKHLLDTGERLHRFLCQDAEDAR